MLACKPMTYSTSKFCIQVCIPSNFSSELKVQPDMIDDTVQIKATGGGQ